MLLNYIRITFRTFLRNPAAFFINLIGLGIALGVSITAFVNYHYNRDFDTQQTNAGRIYRIAFWEESENKRTPYGVAPIPLGNIIRESLRDGEELIQYISKGGQFRVGDEMFQSEVVYADPAFTKVFNVEMLYGSSALSDKTNILISDDMAIKYFGQKDAVGKTITQVISGTPREFEVSGVFKQFQPNSSFRFKVLTSYDNYFPNPGDRSVAENDWSRWTTSFLYLHDASFIQPLTAQLNQYLKTQNDARPDLKAKEFYIESFIGMADRASRQKNQGHWLNLPMPPAAVIAPFGMAAFLLLVACFNFMNNSIAVAGRRLKEIGIRKVIGGRRKELIVQFLSEALIFCMMSMVLGLILAEYFTAGWNGMWAGIELKIRYMENYRFLLTIAGLLLVTALIAGGYPAFYISSFRPIQILRGTTRFGGTNWLTKSLLVFQFSIAMAAVIFALAFYFNSRYQREYDLGYSWRSVIQVPVENASQFELLRNELNSNPELKAIGGSQHHVFTSQYSAAARTDNRMEKEIDMLNVGDGYFDALNIRVLQGRSFIKNQASDVKESLIVNEEFVKLFKLGDAPVGQRVMLNDTTPVFIAGVVKDVYLRALFQPVSPTGFRYVPEESYKYLVASTEPSNLTEANASIKKAWGKLFPTSLYPGQLMEYKMVMTLEHFDSVVILYSFLGLVVIIMSVSGLYSLMSLNLQRRTKELGIRKILGAPLAHILIQSSKLFLIIMIISVALGALLGTVMVNAMMNSVWEYYVAVNPAVLTLAMTILMTIAIATIGFKIKSVTTSNPVDALKHE